VEFFGDVVDRICEVEFVSGRVISELKHAVIFPASHYAVEQEKLNVACAMIERDKEEEVLAVKNALNSVGLDYEAVKNSSPFDLSGGQKRRVAIAGVIVTRPEVLILDEPVAGLDPVGKKELMQLLHKMHEVSVKTIIIVSHDMDEVCENCNKIAVFSEGKCIKVDNPNKLFNADSNIKSLRLDLPITSKLLSKLKDVGIDIDTDYKTQDFIEKVVEKYKNK
jgi:energy-coupling factor transport system ATP-binding protein